MPPGSTKVVVSWAILSWLLDQSAARQVQTFLDEADAGRLTLLMSWINVGEIYYIVARRLGLESAERFLERTPSLPLQFVLPERTDVIAAAQLKASHKLSYADAFAAALAIREGASVITGDPELRALSDLLDIDWIGP